MGFAAALDEGLIVPVIRGVEQKSISEIAAEMDELATKAKDGTLLPDAVLGGTFTVSVLGIVDGFTPILNAGQSAILGVAPYRSRRPCAKARRRGRVQRGRPSKARSS